MSQSLSANQATSDEVLIGRIAKGDRLAMQVLFAPHHVRVYRFVLRLVSNPTMAEDLISEVFLDVWRQADGFEGRECGADLKEVAESVEDVSDNPEVALEKKDRSAVLRQCLEKLPPEHRETIDLVYYHERSAEEVAEIVKIPENTVKTRILCAQEAGRAAAGSWS